MAQSYLQQAVDKTHTGLCFKKPAERYFGHIADLCSICQQYLFVEVVVHVFHHSERSHYNLENMWKEAPMVNINEWIGE